MVSNKTFFSWAYVYCGLGFVGALRSVLLGLMDTHLGIGYRVNLLVNGLTCCFFIGVLLAGVIQRRASFIRAYILYLKIHFTVGMILLVLFQIGLVLFASSYDDEKNKAEVQAVSFIVLCVMAFVMALAIAFFFFALWILKGTLRAVEQELGKTHFALTTPEKKGLEV
ncbi:uncharacterized protein LOC129739596 [Uranotaenia lowii]|uniref:uncharacterized protein LOC129739596 n=1 Tax=Uranotaenia lowii TaxID=190385 RepID=UPI002478AD5C|nr:uncharacterized protein LOC129739596 [Uranotaenia lowii]